MRNPFVRVPLIDTSRIVLEAWGRQSLRALSLEASAVLILALLLPPGARAQEAPDRSPDLTERLDRLCTRLEQRRQVHHIPGMAIAIVKDDKIILARGFGLRDMENELPATEETIFAVGSTTKAFTAMLIAMLADEGVMSFDDPVSRHLPFFRLKDEEANAKVEIQDLLSHRTGLTRQTLLWFGTGITPEDILAQVAEAEPWAPFRTRFLYSNVMVMAAGLASSRAAGKPWTELLHERILEPLGMTRTSASVSDVEGDAQAAKGYAWIDGKKTFKEMPWQNIDNAAPAGAINSTVLDMARWIRFMLARGVFEGKRLVSEERFAELWTEHNIAGPGIGYGMGWMLRLWDKRQVVEHGGNIGGFSAEVGLLPSENLGFVLLMNCTAAGLQQESLGLVWQYLLGELGEDAISPEGIALTGEEIKPFVGPYRVREIGQTAQVKVAVSGRLSLEIPGRPNAELRWPDSEGRWRILVDPTVYITFVRQGEFVTALELHQKAPSGENRVTRMPRTTEGVASVPIDADELCDRYVEAHGSRKLEEIETFRITGKVNLVHTGLKGRIILMGEGMDRFSFDVDFGRFGYLRGVLDYGEAQIDSVYQGLQQLDDEDVQGFSLQSPIVTFGDWRDYYEDVEVVGQETMGTDMVYVVLLTPSEGPPVTMLVDARTAELRGMRGRQPLPIPAIPPEARFEDYQEFDGIRLPARITAQSEPTGRIEVEYEDVAWNVELPDDAFVLKH